MMLCKRVNARIVGGVLEPRGPDATAAMRALRGSAWAGPMRRPSEWGCHPVTGRASVKAPAGLVCSFPASEAAGLEVRVSEWPGPCSLPSGSEIDARIAAHAARQRAAMMGAAGP